MLLGGEQGLPFAAHLAEASIQATPPGLQLFQGEGTGGIAIHQAVDLAAQLGLPPLQHLALARLGTPVQPALVGLTEALGEDRGVGQHAAEVLPDSRIQAMREEELMTEAKKLQAPYDLVLQVHETGQLPVPNFSAGGVATPADASGYCPAHP